MPPVELRKQSIFGRQYLEVFYKLLEMTALPCEYQYIGSSGI